MFYHIKVHVILIEDRPFFNGFVLIVCLLFGAFDIL